MNQELADDAAHAPGRRYVCTVHSPGGITLREVTSWPPSWKCDVK